jgi:hypothetical protein
VTTNDVVDVAASCAMVVLWFFSLRQMRQERRRRADQAAIARAIVARDLREAARLSEAFIEKYGK